MEQLPYSTLVPGEVALHGTGPVSVLARRLEEHSSSYMKTIAVTFCTFVFPIHFLC